MSLKKLSFLSLSFILVMLFTLTCIGDSRAGETGTRYISDRIRVYARAGAGTKYKLLTPLKTGDQVTLLGDVKDDWVHIRYGKNREGWIQKRFLTATEPAAKRLARAQARIATLEQSNKARIASLTETNKEYRKGNTALLREVKELRTKLRKVEKEYKTLHEESADFLALKERYRKLAAENQARKEHEEQLMAECDKLRTAYKIKWFLSGGGVLLVGFFIGIMLEVFRNRKKKKGGLTFS